MIQYYGKDIWKGNIAVEDALEKQITLKNAFDNFSDFTIPRKKHEKKKKNHVLIINFFEKDNCLLVLLKVEYFQCHIPYLVLLMILKKKYVIISEYYGRTRLAAKKISSRQWN